MIHAEEGTVANDYQYSCTVQGPNLAGKPLQINYKPTFRCDGNEQWYFEEQGGIVWSFDGNAPSDLIRWTGR